MTTEEVFPETSGVMDRLYETLRERPTLVTPVAMCATWAPMIRDAMRRDAESLLKGN